MRWFRCGGRGPGVVGVGLLALSWLASSSPAQAQLTSGLWAYYDFEGSTIANAAPSGMSYAVTTSGSPQSGFSGGEVNGTDRSTLIVGNALDLVRSTNDFFSVAIGSGNSAPSDANLLGTFTIAGWHYLAPTPGSATSNRYFVFEATTNFDISWGTGTGSNPLTYTAYNAQSVAAAAPLSANAWQHVAHVFSSDGATSTLDVYVNGTRIGGNSTPASGMDFSAIRFGNSRGTGGRAWDGMLDELAVWNRALSADDVAAAYQLGLDGRALTYVPAGTITWDPAAAGDEWLDGSNWVGGAAPGVTGDPASGGAEIASIGSHASLFGGLGIDMATANGSLALGGISLASDSGPVRIGNSSVAVDGVLRLNGGTTLAGEGTIIDVRGGSDLTIANSADGITTTRMDLALGAASSRIYAATGRTVTITSAIGQAAAGANLEIAGGGTVVLGGANTYTGTTTLTAGALRLAANDVLADASGLILAGGRLELDSFNDTIGAVAITGPGSITGSGTLTSSGVTDSSVAGTFAVEATLAGSGPLSKSGAGTLVLSGANTYSGGTTVSGGTLLLANTLARPAGDVAGVSDGAVLALGMGGFSNPFSGAELAALQSGTLAGVTMATNAIAGVDTSAGDAIIADDLAGAHRLLKLGGNTLTLTGANTSTAGTTVAAGTLVVGDGGTAGTLAGDAVVTGTLAFNRSDDLAFGGAISGTGRLEQRGFGAVTLTGAATHTGGTTILGGTLAVGSGGTSGSLVGNVLNEGTLIVNRSNATSLTGVISGVGGLVKRGTGELSLLTANTYTGPTTVSQGTLTITGSGTTSAFGAITVADGARLLLARNDVWGVHTTAATPVITVEAGGVVENSNTFATLISPVLNGGTLMANDGVSAAYPTFGLRGTVTVGASDAGSRLATTGNGDFNTIAIGTGTAGSLTTFDVADGSAATDLAVTVPLSNMSGASAGLVKTGPGRMVMAAASGYSGGTTIAAGTLAAGVAGAVGPGRVSVGSGATLEIAAADALATNALTAPSTASVTFTATAPTGYQISSIAGGATLDVGTGTLTLGADNSSSAYAGTISGGGLTKAGTGSLTLGGSQGFASLTVAGGTFTATSGGALGTGGVSLAGTLKYSGTEPITNAVTLAGDSTIAVGHNVDYLVVGGGGGGAGRDSSGGGGGGGLLTNLGADSLPGFVSSGDLTVIVGAGGAGGVNTDSNGQNGGNSMLGDLVALGGGGGGRYFSAGSSGGSGGGGGREAAPQGGAGTPGQGNAGGSGSNGATAATDSGGGGGGAGAPGGNAVRGVQGGDGGAGLAVGITGAEVYYAGGGGGSPHRTATIPSGQGGLGGGGGAAVSASAQPTAGAANTGGGGGASRSATAGNLTGAVGGSGVVIVRYAGDPIATGGTITAGTGTAAGTTLHTFADVGAAALTFPGVTRTLAGDVSGSGSLTFNSGSSTLVMSGNNTYSGGTILQAGTIEAASATAVGTGGLEIAAGATARFTADGVSAFAIGGLSGAGTLAAAGKGLTVGSLGGDGAFSGPITAASLTKTGSGTLTLSGSNTLAGTTINGGGLVVGSPAALGSGPVAVSGGTLRLANDTFANVFTLSGDASTNTLGGSVSLEYLLVGGGGGGDNAVSGVTYGGGGGGGGVEQGTLAGLAVGSYDITVGQGGTAPGGNQSTAGSASTAFGTVAAGGEAGSTSGVGNGGASGSGFAGGLRSSFTPGGGGGAGGVGGNGVSGSRTGGAGGVGVASSITGAEAYYGGGGGGAEFSTNTPGAGGLGGGGSGGQAGFANTGGGGGGEANGGSGIVIVRYTGDPIGTGGTISAGTGSAAGYTLHTFTEPGQQSLVLDGATTTIAGVVGGSGGFTWNSAGRLALTAGNTYTGETVIAAGRVALGEAGTIDASPRVSIASGAAFDVSAKSAGYAIPNGQMITGAGGVTGSLAVSAGATVSPGQATGTLAVSGGVTLGPGGSYSWQIYDATGAAGQPTGWDLLAVDGALDVTASSANPFQIDLWSLSWNDPATNGQALNFDATQQASWRIASAAGGITGFAADAFRISTSARNGSGGFLNDLAGGSFGMAVSGSDLNVVFTPAGAPSSNIVIDVASGSQTQAQAGHAQILVADSVTKTGVGTVVMDTANSYTGPTTVSAGTLQVANANAVGSSPVTVASGATLSVASGTTMKSPSVTVNGGTVAADTLAVNAATGVASLAINSGTIASTTAVVVGPGGLVDLPDAARLSVGVASLAVDQGAGGGKIDLGAGQVTIAAGGITAADLRADIIAGRSGGTWSGATGITSAAAAATPGTRAVGYTVAGDGTAKVSFAAPGDTNLDGLVNFSDIQAIISGGRYGQSGTTGVWGVGDFNYDGLVNFTDIQGMLNAGRYGQASYFPAAPSGASLGGLGKLGGAGGIAAVPEPATNLLLIGSAVATALVSRSFSRRNHGRL